MGSSNSSTTADSPRRTKSHKPNCGYKGYCVQAGDSIQTVGDIAVFRLQYIDKRRPAKLNMSAPIDASSLRLDNIVQTLDYHEPLQVERKVQHGFGSGKKREKMSLAEIVSRLKSGDDSFYLTTQYEENEESDENYCSDESISDENDDICDDFDGFGSETGENSQGSEHSGAESDENDEKTEEIGQNDEIFDGKNEQTDSEPEKDTRSADSEPEKKLPILSGHLNSDSESDFDVDFSNLQDDYDEAEHDDHDESEARIRTLFQPPLTNLAQQKNPAFPIIPEPFNGLFTQQINLWMGSSSTEGPKPDFSHPTIASLGKYVPRGNSSGLHHDHADNLYFLVEGRKRFTLFSPENAEKLATVGDINKVYPNGLIDYQVNENARFWRPMREDGAIQAEWALWMLEKGDFSVFSEKYLHGLVANEPKYTGEHLPLDPPSFSSIPPVLLHLDEVDPAYRHTLEELANNHFPGLLSLKKIEVWLEPGNLLYIPVGWFHEVTSFSEEDENAHIAVNWWFVPPAGTLDKPYEDDYWKEDFALTMEAVEDVRE